MRIGIVGSGALGLYYGAKLVQGGNDVRFLLRRDYDAVMARGLKVESIAGDFHLPSVQGYRTPEQLGAVDLVIIGLKTFANHRLRELVSPLIGPETSILTLQNGLGNEELLAQLFGEKRVLGGVAYLACNRGEPGVIHHLGEGRIVLGEFSVPAITSRIEAIARLFTDAGVACATVVDLPRARWEKLIWNIPFNGLSALFAAPVDQLLQNSGIRRLILDLMLEVISAANAQGLQEQIKPERARQMVDFTETLGVYKPSMQIDRELGRQLELQAIFAEPVARGARRGVPMPKVEELQALLGFREPAAD